MNAVKSLKCCRRINTAKIHSKECRPKRGIHSKRHIAKNICIWYISIYICRSSEFSTARKIMDAIRNRIVSCKGLKNGMKPTNHL